MNLKKNLDFDWTFDKSMDTSCLKDDLIETDSEYDFDEFDPHLSGGSYFQIHCHPVHFVLVVVAGVAAADAVVAAAGVVVADDDACSID